MTAADLPALIATAVGSGGAVAIVRPMLDYFKAKRGQTDEVALGLVGRLQKRIDDLEAGQSRERELCDAKLEGLRQELKNVEGRYEAFILAVEIAPEKAAEVVARLKSRRAYLAPSDREPSA